MSDNKYIQSPIYRGLMKTMTLGGVATDYVLLVELTFGVVVLMLFKSAAMVFAFVFVAHVIGYIFHRTDEDLMNIYVKRAELGAAKHPNPKRSTSFYEA